MNVIDAASAGASDGMMLAMNVAAMLIAFLALIAMVDALLGWAWAGLTLAKVFSVVFAPVAFLMGVPAKDIGAMADLLGTKLVANEFVAFVKLTGEYKGVVDPRTPHPRDLRADRVREPRVHRHSARRHRRDGADPPRRPRPARDAGAARGLSGDADQRVRRLDVALSRNQVMA